jgi:hypothetical protein
MELLSSTRLQLVPTVGQRTSEFQIWVQALGGIVDTVAIGCIMYYGTMSYITPESRTPASDNIVAYTISPIGCMNIFFSFTIGEEAYDAFPTRLA